MEVRNLMAFTLFVLLSFIGQTFSDNTCDNDWAPYKDEKCLKVFDTAGLVSYEEAESFCKEKYDANLVSIGFEDKQKFVEEFLKSQTIVDYVWIGLKYESDNNYVWSDGEDFVYSNWASGSPKNDPEYCVQMDTDDAEYGKWIDALCVKRNLVLCEKAQSWSLTQLQNEVMNLKKNQVPIGFIYVQLPNQKTPAEIWEWMTWEDVTSDYAGVFFRAEGGGSASFGTTQQQLFPSIVNVQTSVRRDLGDMSQSTITLNTTNEFSQYIITAEAACRPVDCWRGLAFKQSADEVRPLNMAIRIWVRVS